MNEFKFYGEENTENDDAVQLREQQAEKEAEKERKYKKHSVLTRPPKVRPKKSNFGGRYFYVKIQLWIQEEGSNGLHKWKRRI